MLCTLLQIYHNKVSASLQPREFLLLIKSFRIEFHGKLHDDLNSIFAVFNINQNLWIKKLMTVQLCKENPV